MTKILPLPLKECDKKYFKADPANPYSIMEKIFEARDAGATADDGAEAEALGEIMASAVTHIYRDIKKRVERDDFKIESRDLYTYVAHHLLDACSTDNESDCYLDSNYLTIFAEMISLCVLRLKCIGYDKEMRQELYQAINEKNRDLGYLEA